MPGKHAELPADLIPAIGYIRVSMMREEMISPETQQASIEDAAARRGYRIADWVTDLDATGRNFQRRIMGAIERAEQGPARVILVWKYSRFGRTRTGVAVNLARLEKAGGELISATEDIDARTATGKFMRGMLFEVAAFESDRAGETWHEAYDYRVREGLPPLGRPRFGYRRLGRVRDEEDPHRTRRDRDDPLGERYVQDEELGPVLALMYRDYARGDGGKVIAGRLNARGIPATRGRPWSGRTVLDVLDSGFGAGYLRIHDPACVRCPERGATKCRNRVWVRGVHEPVITEDQWQAYRRRRKDVRTVPPRHINPAHPVTGLVRCGHCGGAMTAGGRGKGGAYFVCSPHRLYGRCPGAPSVTVPALMAAIRERIAEIAGDLDAAAAVSGQRAGTARDSRKLAARLHREIAAIDRQLVRLALKVAADESGAMPAGTWEAAAAKLGADRARLEQQLDAATRESASASADPLPVMAGILAEWDTLPPAGMNQMLRLLIRRVTVWRTADPSRDVRGHWLPQQVRIEVTPAWLSAENPDR